jgi:protein-tyrosine-phosphatase/DNA-binding transcriptional ArsR family regulator
MYYSFRVVPAAASPPEFLSLAGHPLRWRLLHELARSDRRVGELCALTGRPQSLVSYHLRRLRDGGLVRSHRSAADGRDTYYVADLARCGELLSQAGEALHPALGSGASRPAPRASVLFVCTGNSGRSPMAEALAAARSGGRITASSAGSRPKPPHPHAVRVMADRGLDISAHQPRHLDELAGRRFDHVISLCDRVRDACPERPGEWRRAHWSVPDPALEGTLPAYERAADELHARIGFLIGAIERSTTEEEAGRA